MPQVILKAEQKEDRRTRSGAGRTKLYDIDFEPLRDVVGVLKDDGTPAQVMYTPDDFKGADGTVAQLSTVLAQARSWVEDYNDSLKGKGNGYRVASESFPVEKNGNHVKGVVRDGEIKVSKEGTPLYKVYIGVVELKEADLNRRKAMKEARARTREAQEHSEDTGNSENTEQAENQAQTDQAPANA